MYKHSQTGYFIATLLSIFIIIYIAILIIFLSLKTNALSLFLIFLISFIILVTLLCLIIFSKLTVSINKKFIEIYFRFIFRKKFKLDGIKSCKIARNPWYYGFGIRYTPYGWMYNISGLSAVQLDFKNGKSFRIGTDDAVNLCKAIKSTAKHF